MSQNMDKQTIIAFSSVIAVLFGMIQLSVWPLKNDMSKLEARQAKLEAGQAELEAGQAEIKQLIKNQSNHKQDRQRNKNHSHKQDKQVKITK